jgi:hypothetical protein
MSTSEAQRQRTRWTLFAGGAIGITTTFPFLFAGHAQAVPITFLAVLVVSGIVSMVFSRRRLYPLRLRVMEHPLVAAQLAHRGWRLVRP